MLAYVIKLTPDDNDTFLVTCPALPEVTTFGKTDGEIHDAATAAIEDGHRSARQPRGRTAGAR